MDWLYVFFAGAVTGAVVATLFAGRIGAEIALLREELTKLRMTIGSAAQSVTSGASSAEKKL